MNMFKLSAEQVTRMIEMRVESIVGNEKLSKSERMKQLHDLGLSISEIANMMEVKYNFVYNVVSHYVANGVKVETVKEETKKDKIIKLFSAGKCNKDIAIALKTNYNYVYKITKELKDSYAQVAATV